MVLHQGACDEFRHRPARLDEQATVTAFPAWLPRLTPPSGWPGCVVASRKPRRRLDKMVGLAQAETHLAGGRLQGELSAFLSSSSFAEVLQEGSYVDAIIDLPDPSFVIGPKPDVRWMLVSTPCHALCGGAHLPAFLLLGTHRPRPWPPAVRLS